MSSQTTFLVELGTEELPPGSLSSLADAFAESLRDSLETADIAHGEIHAYATPRRLAVKIEQLSERQPDRESERLGPAVAAAFKDGEPTKAATGFAASLGIDVSQLATIDTDKGPRIGYRQTLRGEATEALLPAMVESAIKHLPVAKNMRWGDSRIEFSRPAHWLVMLYGNNVVEGSALGLSAGRTTYGHRVHCSHPIELTSADDYLAQLESPGHVIADQQRRQALIRAQVEAEADKLNAQAVIDDDLLEEVTGLVEWPVALTGSFDEQFLKVPQECLITSMKENQKYFHLVDGNGQLLPSFITIANLESRDPAQVIAGNERVIRPRLADAAFFFDTDRAKPLAERRGMLESVVFQRRLGSMADKSRRIETLAADISERIGGDPSAAARAAQLAKCDLVTEMVIEFSDLQGVMGGYYARHDGESEEVAQAIAEQYLPRNASDAIPASLSGVALALADRLDTLTGIFGIGQRPTGARDPFALRRAAIGVLNILIKGEYDLDLKQLLQLAVEQHTELSDDDRQGLAFDVLEYTLERLRGWAQDNDIETDVFNAVQARPVYKPLDAVRRLQAVQAFTQRPEAKALAAANKRVANILAKHDEALPEEINAALFESDAERDLNEAVQRLREQTQPLFAQAAYGPALDALATLQQPVDTFFDQVMVMAEEPAVRGNRLALLKELQELFLEVADISLLPQ